MRSKGTLAVIASLAVLFAACGSSATDSPTATPTQAVTATPTEAATATEGASPTQAASPTEVASATAGGCVAGATGSQTVTISGFAFGPADLSVTAGTTVTFTNKDGVSHTATANDGSFDCRPLNGGSSMSFTFATAGTFDYHCAIHPSMHGRITVT